jgi:hypothetical protein
MLEIVQPKNDDSNENDTYHKVLPHENNARNRPIIPVSRESNEPIVELTDTKTLLTGAFLDKFLFGQGVPYGLPTQQNWKYFALYYGGQSMIHYLLLKVSINCSMHVAFKTQLESMEKTWLL